MEKKIIIKTPHGAFETEQVPAWYADRKPWEPRNPKFVYSFIPGTVVELRVKEGDKVTEGESLMLYKAMKMDNNILSDREGVISKINVVVGDNLPKNVVMIEFE